MEKIEHKKNIVLTGMPGVGKSTVGTILAGDLMRPFIDTDLLIESGEGKRLQEIISLSGMMHFLALEEKYIMALEATSSVISTGGSVIYSSKTMDKLAAAGIVIHLDLALSEIEKRFSCMDERGVARAPGQKMESLYKERLPLYKRYAHLSINCNGLSPAEIKNRIMQNIETI